MPKYQKLYKLILEQMQKSEAQIIRCEHCSSIFCDNSSYCRHLEEVHEKDKLFRCGLCTMSFARKDRLLRHLRAIHWDMKHQCPKCNQRFVDKFKLNLHLQNKHNAYYCKECKEIYLTQEHTCLSKKETYQCDVPPCSGKVFKLYSFYLNHIRKVHNVSREEDLPQTPIQQALLSEKPFYNGVQTRSTSQNVYSSKSQLASRSLGFYRFSNISSTDKNQENYSEEVTRASTNQGDNKQGDHSGEITPVKLSDIPRTRQRRTLPNSPNSNYVRLLDLYEYIFIDFKLTYDRFQLLNHPLPKRNRFREERREGKLARPRKVSISEREDAPARKNLRWQKLVLPIGNGEATFVSKFSDLSPVLVAIMDVRRLSKA